MIPGVVSVDDKFIYFRHKSVFSEAPKAWGGRWDSSRKAWRLPRLRLIADRLEKSFPGSLWSDDAKSYLDGVPIVDVDQSAHWSWDTLYEFQKDAVDYLVSSRIPGSLLALSPGLGKTAVAIVAAEALGKQRILVIAPLSLLRTWRREIWEWSADGNRSTVQIAHGESPSKDPPVRWTVSNYHTVVGRLRDEYKKVKWDLVIIDESIMVKSRGAQRSQTLLKLRNQAKCQVWELSGSPVSKFVDDLYMQFQILYPKAFTSYWRFVDMYCLKGYTPWTNYLITGSRTDIDFQEEFRDIMFVRNQKDVLPDLPEFIFHEIELELHQPQRKAYDDLVDDFSTTLSTGDKVQVSVIIAQLVRLQQIASNLMNVEKPNEMGVYLDISIKADAIDQILETQMYELPMLIWVHWRRGAQALYNRLKKKDYNVGILLGGEGEKGAEKLEDFHEGKYDILILSMGVGKYGHTLTNTKTVIYYDKTWDMDAYVQSRRRVQRIGLEHRPVMVTLKCIDTVDEYVEANLAGKAPSVAQVSQDDLHDLMMVLGGWDVHTSNRPGHNNRMGGPGSRWPNH